MTYFGLIRIKANTIRAIVFLRCELRRHIVIVANPTKTVALPPRVVLPPRAQAPIAEEISLLQSIDAHIAEEGGLTVVSIPIGTEERTVGLSGMAARTTSCAASRTCRQVAAPSSPSNRSRREQAALSVSWRRPC